jgi:hypothetical protein
MTDPIRLQIAEKGVGSLNFLALLRWALVVIFLWFGGMKFTAYEAAGVARLIEHSPIMSWLHTLLGVQGASYVIGVLELSTAAALILGAFQPIFSALGAAMSASTCLITALLPCEHTCCSRGDGGRISGDFRRAQMPVSEHAPVLQECAGSPDSVSPNPRAGFPL